MKNIAVSSAEKREGRGQERYEVSLFCAVPRHQDQMHPAQTLLAI